MRAEVPPRDLDEGLLAGWKYASGRRPEATEPRRPRTLLDRKDPPAEHHLQVRNSFGKRARVAARVGHLDRIEYGAARPGVPSGGRKLRGPAERRPSRPAACV